MDRDKIEQMALQIFCAELGNGLRSYWLQEIKPEVVSKMAAASVAAARKIVEESSK